MTGEIPPARQCTLPTCTDEAADTTHGGQLCERHLEELGEGVNSSDESSISDTSTELDNQTDTTDGVGGDGAGEGESACTSDDKSSNRTAYSTALEALRDGPLADLGAVFVPIPPGEKGTHRPRTPENLYTSGDDVLEAYIEAGHNYGVVCQNDLAVVDADEPDDLCELLEALPETAWQVSGSRSSEHHFLQVPGLDEDIPLVHPESGEELGHIKAAEQSYVVGPGSRHPSGGRYGPLEGETIATVDETDLRDLIEPFRPDGVDRSETEHTPVERATRSGGTDGHDIGVYDVLSSGSYPTEARCEHPFHGSSTGSNFMVDADGETWRCWRHNCTGNALHLVGIDEGVISCGDWKYGGLSTDTWREIFTAAREVGYDLPEWGAEDDREPVAALPFKKLEALSEHERERAVRKRTPSTAEARDRLRDALFREFRAGNATILDAPTALGKSYTGATTPWLNHADVTGEAPVIHAHATTDARDGAAKETQQSSANGAVLKGRKEKSPLARGDHDPVEDPDTGEEEPDVVVTIDGLPASDWFDTMCDEKGLPFSTALALARDRNDQGLEELPPIGEEDPAVAQWNGLPRDDEGDPAVDVIHATHQFLHVPSLRRATNVILDEQPDYTVDSLTQNQIRRMVNAYLQEIGAPVTTWEAFVQLARFDPTGTQSDATTEQGVLGEMIGAEPSREWYVEDPDAHALAPDLTKAIWKALRWEDPDTNGRRNANVFHEPPRLDAGEGEQYSGTWLSVVIDEENTVRTVRNTPDFSQARAVIGLDAHPSMPMWELNAGGNMIRDTVLEPTERRLWRRYERGLTVVQVGDATRPRSGEAARNWMNDDRVRAVLEKLREHYGDGFDTAVTTAQVEPAVRRILQDVTGETLDDEHTLHFGEEKSRNPAPFVDADAGYVYGCMDPGDDMILDALAELGLEAEPGTVETDDGEVKREKGRTFDGPDADSAAALLASVRENHVAQGAGRLARTPDDPESSAVAYLHTDAAPSGFVDLQTPGVEWLATDLQREIVDELTERPSATTREISEAVGCSKKHVRETLQYLEGEDVVDRHERTGDHGADVYQDAGAEAAIIDLGETATDPLKESSRWSVAVCRLHADSPAGDGTDGGGDTVGDGVATDGGRPNGGDPPPDDPE